MRQIVLLDESRRQRALDAVREAQIGQVVVIKEATANSEQKAKFWAICTDLEKAGITWFGKPRSKDQWMVLLVSGHATATKQGSEVIGGLEGELVNVRESIASMPKSRMSSLLDYAESWVAQRTGNQVDE